MHYQYSELSTFFDEENDEPVCEKIKHLLVVSQKVQNSKMNQSLYVTRQTKSETHSRMNIAEDRMFTTGRFSERQFFDAFPNILDVIFTSKWVD